MKKYAKDKALQELTHILDYVMPGIKKMFNS